MSNTQSQKIIQILENIIPLLNATDDSFAHTFALYFEKILLKLNQPHDLFTIAEKLSKLFGGMGTFNDLILHKNLKVLYKEQADFEILTDKLFELCQNIIIEQRGGLTIQDFDGEYFIPIERVNEIKRMQNNRKNDQKKELENDNRST